MKRSWKDPKSMLSNKQTNKQTNSRFMMALSTDCTKTDHWTPVTVLLQSFCELVLFSGGYDGLKFLKLRTFSAAGFRSVVMLQSKLYDLG